MPLPSWYRRRLDALYEIIHTVAGAADTDDLLAVVVARITEALGADRATLYVVDPETGELYSKVLTGDSELEIRLEIGQGLAGWVAMTQRPIVINDVLKDDRFDGRWDARSGYRTRTVLGVPVNDADGRLIGVIQVLNKLRGRFDDEDRRMLEAIAALCAIAMEKFAAEDALAAR